MKEYTNETPRFANADRYTNRRSGIWPIPARMVEASAKTGTARTATMAQSRFDCGFGFGRALWPVFERWEGPHLQRKWALMRRHVKRSVLTDTLFVSSSYVLLLSALLVDPLLIRCMLVSVMGCCYLQRVLFFELSIALVPAHFRSHPDGTSKKL
jgi:hypothetical protein